MIYENLLQIIGKTPLVKIPFQTQATIAAKLEYLNPGGSLKDRSAFYMIQEAEKKGILKPGGTIIDASSGNHGIAVAMIGAAKGYKVIITVCTKISKEKLATLKAYGAEVIMCPVEAGPNDPENNRNLAVTLAKQIPNAFMPDQYFNTVNRDAHYLSTGPEIWEQTEGKITHFFVVAGTGGTSSGAGLFLKEKNPDIKIIAVDSKNSFHATQGNPQPCYVEGMGIDFDSPVPAYDIYDEIVEITDEQAFNVLQPLARNHGLLVGLSSGAVYCVAQQYAPQLKKNELGVMIFGDSGRAYLSKGLYGEALPDKMIQMPHKKAKQELTF
ncbi:TPA: cystathionine beta-synthase [Candidatus Dependentiae bacterium]|nr:MAG: Cystathionine beta-synthase [candidate division TM6 bacterium GW2011_GWF2_36_131]KKQ03464.1 MAG: Cystathionine beta-synthase [candidate division TM6 bacterium GW2011_GWE2_36_25]KKQ20262.1 MAG: Cystathionine beta-synthase [candidate division TM6 bacterium GW2011_GWA2_36_9]HBR70802.1 cystathionine beta-synthase [Candidatus Dependentiae bacterium]HCU00187.1 cystathionine beta-synthase [Candidatus Dependentiae bacterium]